MPDGKEDYNENSIDSKLTELLTREQLSSVERKQFRVEILDRLSKIEVNTTSHAQSIAYHSRDIEDLKTSFEKNQRQIAARINPVIESYERGKNSWWTIRNFFVGLAFILSLWASIQSFLKK